MSLVTRVSVAFLVALALALGGFSACLYYLAGLRLRLALDQELEATLDRFPDRPEGAERPRDLGHLRRDGAEDRERAGRRAADDPRRPRPRPARGGRRDDDRGARRPAMAGARAADRRRTPPSRAARGPRRGTSPEAAGAGRAQGRRRRAASARLACWPRGPRSSRWRPRSDRWRPSCR